MPSEVGASLGFGAGGNGKKSGSFGVNSGSSNRDSAWVNDMTEITGANVDIVVAGKTSITGAMIDGDDNLHLTTNELEFKDLHDFERVGETGFGVSSSIGVSTDKGETSLHPNGETSLTLKDTGHDRKQITRATIGAGVIEVGGKVADDAELSGLNRDTTKAQEITKDMTTGALDATVTIDNRVFTEEGRNSIADEHEDLKEDTITILKDMSVAAITTIGLLWGSIEYAYSYILNEEKPNIIIDNEKNKIMFTKNIFASNILGVDGAITLGNIQLYYNKNNPYKIVAPYSTTDYGFMPLEYHEDAHINQWHRDGALKFIWNWLQNGGASMHNSYEREASLEGMNRLKDEGVYHIIQNNKYKYYKNGEIE